MIVFDYTIVASASGAEGPCLKKLSVISGSLLKIVDLDLYILYEKQFYIVQKSEDCTCIAYFNECPTTCEALPGVLGIQGEGLFIFRDLGSRIIYFQRLGEKA